MTIFSNDILSKLISPSYESIDSIDQLNQRSDITTITWKDSFVIKNNLVFKLNQFKFEKLIIFLISWLINLLSKIKSNTFIHGI